MYIYICMYGLYIELIIIILNLMYVLMYLFISMLLALNNYNSSIIQFTKLILILNL